MRIPSTHVTPHYLSAGRWSVTLVWMRPLHWLAHIAILYLLSKNNSLQKIHLLFWSSLLFVRSEEVSSAVVTNCLISYFLTHGLSWISLNDQYALWSSVLWLLIFTPWHNNTVEFSSRCWHHPEHSPRKIFVCTTEWAIWGQKSVKE